MRTQKTTINVKQNLTKEHLLKKKSFIMHKDSLDILDDLDDRLVARLFRIIKSFQNGEEIVLTKEENLLFIPFRNQFFRDNDKYLDKVQKNSMGGKKSAAIRYSKSNINSDEK